jgi:hypothetical protein
LSGFAGELGAQLRGLGLQLRGLAFFGRAPPPFPSLFYLSEKEEEIRAKKGEGGARVVWITFLGVREFWAAKKPDSRTFAQGKCEGVQ